MNKKQVIEIIGIKRWKEFEEFMKGQTVGINKDGSINYYELDIENFQRKKENRFFD
ncbi:hypothetical protein KJ972_05070 [Candidatus Micrarchaeota archaeon]|nr:hypothetical protein [Candidatus Micrarchaeota archaeon]